MGNDNGPEAIRERLDKLEKRLARRNTWMAVSLVLIGFVLGAVSSCTKTTSDTIEARKIILKDPSGHTLAVLGVDNNWGGLEAKNYYPGIEFRDEKGERTMSLFGTGLSVRYGDEQAQFSFTGLDIRDKETQILLNPRLFSFAAKQGAVTLTPHPTGMNLTQVGGRRLGRQSWNAYCPWAKAEVRLGLGPCLSRIEVGFHLILCAEMDLQAAVNYGLPGQ